MVKGRREVEEEMVYWDGGIYATAARGKTPLPVAICLDSEITEAVADEF